MQILYEFLIFLKFYKIKNYYKSGKAHGFNCGMKASFFYLKNFKHVNMFPSFKI